MGNWTLRLFIENAAELGKLGRKPVKAAREFLVSHKQATAAEIVNKFKPEIRCEAIFSRPVSANISLCASLGQTAASV